MKPLDNPSTLQATEPSIPVAGAINQQITAPDEPKINSDKKTAPETEGLDDQDFVELAEKKLAENNNDSPPAISETEWWNNFRTQTVLQQNKQKLKFKEASFYRAWKAGKMCFIASFGFGCVGAFLILVENFIPLLMLSKEQVVVSTYNSIESLMQAKNVEILPPKNPENAFKYLTGIFNTSLVFLSVMAGLLAAVGTTICIGVMKFAFSNEDQQQQDNESKVVIPFAAALAEFLSALTTYFKK